MKLIGHQKEQLLQLRIKDNVDLAGLSLQLDLYKGLNFLLLVPLNLFLNNNLLIALILTAIMDAEED